LLLNLRVPYPSRVPRGGWFSNLKIEDSNRVLKVRPGTPKTRPFEPQEGTGTRKTKPVLHYRNMEMVLSHHKRSLT
jgi:hypothetical protein